MAGRMHSNVVVLCCLFICLSCETLSQTTSVCPNGVVEPGEQCDDNNNAPQDGCYFCQKDPGFDCIGNPSVCDCSKDYYHFGVVCKLCLRDVNCNTAGKCWKDASCLCDMNYTHAFLPPSCTAYRPALSSISQVVPPKDGGIVEFGTPKSWIDIPPAYLVTEYPVDVKAYIFDAESLQPYPEQPHLYVASQIVVFQEELKEIPIFEPFSLVLSYPRSINWKFPTTSLRIYRWEATERRWMKEPDTEDHGVDEQARLVHVKIGAFGTYAVLNNSLGETARVWTAPVPPAKWADVVYVGIILGSIFFTIFTTIACCVICKRLGKYYDRQDKRIKLKEDLAKARRQGNKAEADRLKDLLFDMDVEDGKISQEEAEKKKEEDVAKEAAAAAKALRVAQGMTEDPEDDGAGVPKYGRPGTQRNDDDLSVDSDDDPVKVAEKQRLALLESKMAEIEAMQNFSLFAGAGPVMIDPRLNPMVAGPREKPSLTKPKMPQKKKRGGGDSITGTVSGQGLPDEESAYQVAARRSIKDTIRKIEEREAAEQAARDAEIQAALEEQKNIAEKGWAAIAGGLDSIGGAMAAGLDFAKPKRRVKKNADAEGSGLTMLKGFASRIGIPVAPAPVAGEMTPGQPGVSADVKFGHEFAREEVPEPAFRPLPVAHVREEMYEDVNDPTAPRRQIAVLVVPDYPDTESVMLHGIA